VPRVETDEAREHRIHMEIVVDCYGEVERAMGWYCYLQDKLTFPFLARCIAKRVTSPLKVGDEVEVLGMAPDGECEREMLVVMRWEKEGLAVPLSQLEVIHADDDGETEQAVCDWLYWSTKGYRF
jgi:Calcium binding